MKAWGPLLLGVAFAVVGCGKASNQNTSEVPSFEVPQLESQREEFLNRFPVLNELEEEAPPKDPVTGKSPFGVLIWMPKAKEGEATKGGYCSISHFSPGLILTNQHCVMEDKNPKNYFVVFYNKRGRKRFERIVRFEYEGNVEAQDVAVLRIHPDVVEHWDTTEGMAADTSADIGSRNPIDRKVTVWSFNPFEDNHPELVKKFHGPGMRFMPKHCDGSRTRPRLEGIGVKDDGEEFRMPIIHTPSKEKMHWFIDSCDARPVKGNSGSLITDSKDIRKMYGTYHWNIPADQKAAAKFIGFEYRANSGQVQRLSWADLKDRDFYGVGTDLMYLLSLKPGLF